MLLFAAAVVLLYAGRHLTFFYDEWDYVLGRRGSSVAAYLDPHNGHLSAVSGRRLQDLVRDRRVAPLHAVSGRRHSPTSHVRRDALHARPQTHWPMVGARSD